ncbi:MAG: thioredoxin domain-containing protein [Planctomycetes bacterium]|nr:thioredoxin domain-containing protein [Planctomycetota bacterium]
MVHNRLNRETSPYLLQHRDNPVDWHPWGPEALERAKTLQKPIFLSIGYSACHWCHVMEHESFENEVIAAALNEKFVCIKVDREERPDLDQIYMNAVQMMTGRGGWPMSMFLTPDLQPFFAGTYWPPTAGRGMPGFDSVIASVSDAWENRREQAVKQAGQITEHLRNMTGGESSGELSVALIHGAMAPLERQFDFTFGGFGGAPKFPHPMSLRLLLRAWRRQPNDAVLNMVRLNLNKMAGGGIYDHLGGGFARYSVDERWLVPHFEKMLYDNALLAEAYVEGYLATGDAHYAQIARETFDYVLRDMTDPAGGFYSTEDADSEGVEGKFYVWKPSEVTAVLGEEAAKTFCYVYDVTDEGNFEGDNILNLPKTIEQCAQLLGRDAAALDAELGEGRAKLLEIRGGRVRPERDDKVLVSWNGLMIHSLAVAAGALDEPRYLAAATAAAEFICQNMRRDDGRLLHTWRGGTARLDAYLDDYASLTNALISLYEAGFDERWIDEAVRLADIMLARFHDADGGGFFFTADDHEELIARNKDAQDNATPSGSSMAATALVRLGKLTGRQDYVDAARSTLEASAFLMSQHAMAAGQMLIALDLLLGPTVEMVICGGEQSDDVLAGLRRRFIPNKVVACRRTGPAEHQSAALDALLSGKRCIDKQPTVYVCENHTCGEPAVGEAQITALWDQLN